MSSGWKERLAKLGIGGRRRSGVRPAVPRRAPTTPKGRAGEAAAAAFLEERGVAVVDRNVRAGGGEIDLVARDGGAVVFVEVKWRRDASRGAPAEAVTPAKRRRILSAARGWLSANPSAGEREVRFDVVSIEGEAGRVEWIRGAFDAS